MGKWNIQRCSCACSDGSYVSQVVKLSVEKSKTRIHHVVCAIDSALAVNPDGVKAQMESGIIFGLTAALYGDITLEEGNVKRRNFPDYRMRYKIPFNKKQYQSE